MGEKKTIEALLLNVQDECKMNEHGNLVLPWEIILEHINKI